MLLSGAPTNTFNTRTMRPPEQHNPCLAHPPCRMEVSGVPFFLVGLEGSQKRCVKWVPGCLDLKCTGCLGSVFRFRAHPMHTRFNRHGCHRHATLWPCERCTRWTA